MFRFNEGISTWYTLQQRAGSAEIRLGGAVEHGPGEFAFERRLYAEREGVTCSDVKRRVCHEDRPTKPAIRKKVGNVGGTAWA